MTKGQRKPPRADRRLVDEAEEERKTGKLVPWEDVEQMVAERLRGENEEYVRRLIEETLIGT